MKRIILAAAVLMSSNFALAAAPEADMDLDTYVGISVGSAEQKVSLDGYDISKSDTAFQIVGGYRITPNVAVEIGYTHFGKAEISGNGLSVSSKPQALHVAAVGSYNFTKEFAITGKLGAAHARTKLEGTGVPSDTETHNSLVYGVGVSYAISPVVSLTAEYQNFGKLISEDGGDLKAHLVSVGVHYNF